MRREAITIAARTITVCLPLLFLSGAGGLDAGLSVVAALFLLHCALTRDWRWLGKEWVRCMVLAWLYMMLRGAFSVHPHDALQRAVPFFRFIIAASALGYWTLRDDLTRGRFLNMLTFAILFAAFDAVIQFFFVYDIFLHPLVIQESSYFRLTGPFGNQVLGIMLTWLSFPAILHLLFTPEGTLRRDSRFAERLFGVALVMTAIAISGERMALALALLGWLIAAFLLPVRKRYPLYILGAGIVILTLLILTTQSIADRMFSFIFVFDHWDTSPYGLLLKTDIKAVALNPIFGIGANNFRTACWRMYPDLAPIVLGTFCNLHPHNIYFEWLIENGSIGFTLFIAFVCFVFRDCWRAWPLQKGNPVFVGFIIAFFFRGWPFISTTSFFSHWGAPPFWLALGGLIAYTAAATQENRNADTAFAVKNSGL